MIIVLAQDGVNDVAMYCIIFAGIILLAFVGLYIIKKKLDPRKMESGSSQGLSLEQLDEMHDSGQISQEEFKKLRRALLGIVEKNIEPKEGNSDIIENSDDDEDKDIDD